MSLGGDNTVWTRALSEFESLVPEGKDNPTGQKYRFQQIVDFGSVLSLITTENLVEELKRRPDSPFNDLDIDGLNEKVADREYILGELRVESTGVKVLNSLFSTDSLERVRYYAERHFDRVSSRTKIYKSVLVEVQSFD